MRSKTLAALVAAAFSASSMAANAAEKSVEVVHWWTSGGEAAALKVLKDDKRAIFQAAAHAQRAADYLVKLQPGAAAEAAESRAAA